MNETEPYIVNQSCHSDKNNFYVYSGLFFDNYGPCFSVILGGEAIEDSFSEQIIHFQDIEG